MPGIISTYTRDYWGDRNPIQVPIRYASGAIAPHAGTERAKYTVPTGKKAQVQNYLTRIKIMTAAGVAAQRFIYCGYIPLGSANTYLLAISDMNDDKNTVGETVVLGVGLSTNLLVGDAINILTIDISTGGETSFDGTVSITEYDM